MTMEIIGFNCDIAPSPFGRRVEISPDGLSGLNVKQLCSVPPVDRARAGTTPDRGANGINPWLQTKLRAEELETPASRLQADHAVVHGSALLAVQRAPVARVIEDFDAPVLDWCEDVDVDRRGQPPAGRRAGDFDAIRVAERDVDHSGDTRGRRWMRVGGLGGERIGH